MTPTADPVPNPTARHTASLGLHITPYICPNLGCVGGLISDGAGGSERCLHCAGSGLTDDPMDGAERAPRPPGVMRTACADCAYREGSPEMSACVSRLPADEPFFCHQGLPISASGQYQPVAMYGGLPLGAMVCAGWWAARTGEELPARAYREVPLGEDGIEERWAGPARRNVERAVEAQRVTVYLSTPCATPNCGHPFNWHKAGVCVVPDCRCIAFAAPATAAVDVEEVPR